MFRSKLAETGFQTDGNAPADERDLLDYDHGMGDKVGTASPEEDVPHILLRKNRAGSIQSHIDDIYAIDAGPVHSAIGQGQFVLDRDLSIAPLNAAPQFDIMKPVPDLPRDLTSSYGAGVTELIAQSYNAGLGRYEFTGNQDIDAALIGSRWTLANLTFSFPTSGTFYQNEGYGAGTEPAGQVVFNDAQQAGVRYALGLIAAYTSVTFTEVTESTTTHANLRLSQTSYSGVGSAYGNFPSSSARAGDIWFGMTGQPYYDTPDIGNWGLATIMHELGHTLGLKHGHQNYTNFDLAGSGYLDAPAGGGARYGSVALPSNHNGQDWSLMTYYSDPLSSGGFEGEGFNQPQTYMQNDIAALQHLYGANFQQNSGDTVYSWSATTGSMSIDGVAQGSPTSNKILMTLWDGDGVDTYDLSNYSNNLNVDLNPGSFSTFLATQLVNHRAYSGGTAIAVGNVANALLYNGDVRSLVENVAGGSGNDTLVGNQANNALSGGGGTDALTGGKGDDIIDGGANTDVASFSGNFSRYQIVENVDGSFTVTDGNGVYGSDTLTNVELASFDDGVRTLNHAPTVANSIADQLATEDQGFSFTFAANAFADVDAGDVLTYTATDTNGNALPSWLVFNAATRTFSGTPDNGDVGTISVKVMASDGQATVSDIFTIHIANSNDAPTVANLITDQAATEDQSFSFTFAANVFADPDVGDILTYTATDGDGNALPSWLVFNAATRTFSGTPDNGDVSAIVVKVTAFDGLASVSTTFNLTVANVNDAPTVANPITDQTATRDLAFNFTFAANAFADVDVGDVLTYTATDADGNALPSWLIFNAATRTFSGTPDSGDVGTISIKVTASDGQTTVSDIFNLVVSAPNNPPTVANPIADQAAIEDQGFSFTFAANVFADADIGDVLTYTATDSDGNALPSWLVFNAATRTFSGTPDNGDVGTISVKVTASDGHTTMSDVFTIDIANVNDTPTVANPITDQAATEDQSFSFTFAANAFADADVGDVLTYKATDADGNALPSWLVFNAATRTFSGTPDNSDIGTISVKVTASDGQASVSDVFELTVTGSGQNNPPTVANPIADQSATEDQALNFTFAANAFADADVGDLLTYTATDAEGNALPSWLVFNAATRTFSGTPDNGDVGTISVKVTASDGQATVSDVFSIAIANVNDAPTNLALSNASVWENSTGGTFVGNLSATEPDAGDSLVYSIDDPSGSFAIVGTALEVADGANLDYESKKNYTITITATDEGGLSVEKDFVINIGDLVTSVDGNNGNNRLVGTIGRDVIRGFGGNDRLNALAGDDVLNGGKGNDRMTGGGGSDTFIFGAKYGTDIITDFNTGSLNHDLINLSKAAGIDSFRDMVRHHIDRNGTELHIEADDGSTLILQHTAVRDLDSSMFIF